MPSHRAWAFCLPSAPPAETSSPLTPSSFTAAGGHLAGSYLLTRALVTEGTSPRILCHELTFLPIRATQVAPGGAGWHDGSDGCGCSALRVAAAIARRRRSQSLSPHILFTFIVIASEVYRPKLHQAFFPHH